MKDGNCVEWRAPAMNIGYEAEIKRLGCWLGIKHQFSLTTSPPPTSITSTPSWLNKHHCPKFCITDLRHFCRKVIAHPHLMHMFIHWTEDWVSSQIWGYINILLSFLLSSWLISQTIKQLFSCFGKLVLLLHRLLLQEV